MFCEEPQRTWIHLGGANTKGRNKYIEKQILKGDKICMYKYELFCVEEDNTFLWLG